MGIGVVYIQLLTEFIKDILPAAAFVFFVKLIFSILYTALNGKVG